MFICGECGSQKEELGTYQESRPYGESVAYEIMTDFECGCGEEFEEAVQCPVCDEWFVEMNGCCTDCKGEILTVENALKYIRNNDLEQEFFVDWFTSANVSECTSLLTQACERLFNWYYTEKDPMFAKMELFEFIEDDIDYYVEWYLESEV